MNIFYAGVTIVLCIGLPAPSQSVFISTSQCNIKFNILINSQFVNLLPYVLHGSNRDMRVSLHSFPTR